MLKIVCTGDSHTWGQGAKGAVEAFDPPVVAGELRPVDFGTGSYVNVLRRAVEDGVPLADANARLASLSLSELKAEWLDDNWHPNDRGHALYANELLGLLLNLGWI